MEFGTCGVPRGRVCGVPRVCGASRAACHVFCPWNARSGFPGRCARAGLHGKPRRFGARVMSPGLSRHECRGTGARCPMWGTPRERALVEMCRVTSWLHGSAIGGDIGIAPRDERASRKPPPWQCSKNKKEPRSKYMARAGCGKHPDWAKEALVSGMG